MALQRWRSCPPKIWMHSCNRMVSSSDGSRRRSVVMVIASKRMKESGSPYDDCCGRNNHGLTKDPWRWPGYENTQPLCAMQGCHWLSALHMGLRWASLSTTTSKSSRSLSLTSSEYCTHDGDCCGDVLICVCGCNCNHSLDQIDHCGDDRKSVKKQTSGGCCCFCLWCGCGVYPDALLTLSAREEYHRQPSGRGWPIYAVSISRVSTSRTLPLLTYLAWSRRW